MASIQKLKNVQQCDGLLEREKEKIKQKYPLITDEDLNFREGKEVEMIEMLGYKLGKTIDEMRRIINEL